MANTTEPVRSPNPGERTGGRRQAIPVAFTGEKPDFTLAVKRLLGL